MGIDINKNKLKFYHSLQYNVILFLFHFKNNSCLGKKDSHFCLAYGNVFKMYLTFLILIHVRGNWKFRRLIFQSNAVESEPAVLKEIPPLYIVDSLKKTKFD